MSWLKKIEDGFLTGASKVLGAFSYVIKDVDDVLEEKTGKSLTDRIVENEEKENKLKEEKPGLWALKKLGQGTIKGIIGGSVHKD